MAYQKKTADENRSSWRKGIRKGFNIHGRVECQGCFEKNIEIDGLKEELQKLKQRIRSIENPGKTKEPDESHEPSSRQKYKKNSKEENSKKKGGAENGHIGHGRKQGDERSESVRTDLPCECPDCHIPLSPKDTKNRTIVEVQKIKAKRLIIGLKRGQCPGCRKIYQASINCFPKALYGNRLLSQAAVMHYLHGVPIGRLLEIFGPEVSEGGLFQAFHRIGMN